MQCGMGVEVGEQVAGAGSRLPSSGLWGSGSGWEACWELPVLAEPSLAQKKDFYILFVVMY